MVICKECKKEMLDEKVMSCSTGNLIIIIKRKPYRRNTNYFDLGNSRDSKNRKRCHDCNILNKKGNLHHFGCDIERCPKCKGQLISCGCLDS